jgi:DNA-binding protein Fis
MSLLTNHTIDAIRNKTVDVAKLKVKIENEILETLMESVRWNQSKGAKAYGVSRGTFRSILKDRFNDKYIAVNGSK